MNTMESTKKRQLSETERRNLKAAVLRILPSSQGVGAAEAGCPEYAVQVLETRLKPQQLEKVKRGMEFTEQIAQQLHEDSFANLEAPHQDAILMRVQQTPHPTLRDFFHRLIQVSLEGFLCHPQHGGNIGRVGWLYLGLEQESERNTGSGSRTRETATCTTH